MRTDTPPEARSRAPEDPAIPAVEVSGIARRFGRRWALRGVSLRVRPGEVVALLGGNGSGKTTLLRILSTALRPTRGEGKVYGFDLRRDADAIRERIGVLGHAPGLYGDLTAAENLAFALRMEGRDADPAAIRAALETVGLATVAGERARTFSAGMQRRLALARVMLRRPALVLLDEPYASFDVKGIELVNAFLAELKAAGHAAIVSTHDLPRASGVADRVIEIVDGVAIERESLRNGATAETVGADSESMEEQVAR
jgi:heme exporter protein A